MKKSLKFDRNNDNYTGKCDRNGSVGAVLQNCY